MEATNYLASGTGDRLRDILNRYRNVEVVHPAVSKLCEVPKNKALFQKCLKHDLCVLRDRSHDLARSEVSIYQKAFVILMEKEEDRIGGIELYVEELLGLRLTHPADEVQTLKTAIKSRGLIQKTIGGDETIQLSSIRMGNFLPSYIGAKDHQQHREPTGFTKVPPLQEESLFLPQVSDIESPRFAKPPDSTTPKDVEFFVIDPSGKAAPQPKPAHPSHDPKLERLWELYQNALQDFSKDRKDCFQRTTAAKFLRDTIENCINYMESKKSAISSSHPSEKPNHSHENAGDQEKLIELRMNLEEAIRAAEKGSGGKKRSFDYGDGQTLHFPKKSMLNPLTGESAASNPDKSKEKLTNPPTDKSISMKPNAPLKVLRIPLNKAFAQKKLDRLPQRANASSPIFDKSRNNIPISSRSQRISDRDTRRSISPRELKSVYRGREGFQRLRDNGRRYGERRYPRNTGDRYRPSY